MKYDTNSIIAHISLQRINSFLLEEEVESWASTLKRAQFDERDEQIGFSNASLQWHSPTQQENRKLFELRDIDISIPPSSLTLVTGATGSGKSALLAALLGG